MSAIPAFAIAISLGVAALMAFAVVRTAGYHGHFTMDVPGAIQTFHSEPTPRIGGVCVYGAVAVAWAAFPKSDAASILLVILIAGLPAFVFGLAEDLTRRVGVAARLLATMTAGVIAWVISGTLLNRIDVPFIDGLLSAAPVALAFTAFALGGVANSINIIDGFNGLASGTVLLALLAINYVARSVGDAHLAAAALVIAASAAGFMLLNFPWGKLFLGDGGAYFLGFALAWLALLLPTRNPAVSPWTSFLVCAYPVIEVVYSILRRSRRRQSPGEPDRHHLHSLMAVHVVLPRVVALPEGLRNSAVSVVMWLFTAVPAIFAVALYQRTGALMVAALACVLIYHLVYRWVSSK